MHTLTPLAVFLPVSQLLTQSLLLSPLLSDRIRLDLSNEDILRRYVQDLQATLVPEVARQLDDFR